MTLRNKQSVFIDEYLKDFNATQAAIRAGYSPKTARVIGQENLTKPAIQAEYQARLAERIMSPDEIKASLTEIGRGDMADLMDISTMGFTLKLLDDDGNIKPQTRLIRKIKQKVTTFIAKKESDEDREIVETEIELYSKLEAIEFSAKLNDMVINKTELSGPNGGAIPVQRFEAAIEKVYGENGSSDSG